MSDNTESAILAGGCFWIMQQLLRQPDGVLTTRAGWTGGETADPTEDNPGVRGAILDLAWHPNNGDPP